MRAGASMADDDTGRHAVSGGQRTSVPVSSKRVFVVVVVVVATFDIEVDAGRIAQMGSREGGAPG